MADTASNIAWTRKYRPRSFDEYMCDNVKNLVMNRFKNPDNYPQTIMLYGTRGTGKTSMARLLAKEIHCMHKVNGHACGQCEMCQMIDEYISSNEAGTTCDGIIEVDAATTTGKNDINDIIDQALIEPLYPITRTVLTIDECHKLSNSAQNSLLKVIEEPPPHLIFIFCTTDPDDVIPTIHSRMQLKIEVRKKTVDELANRLMWIGEQEKLQISLQACQLIAKKADRVPREAINLLETVAKNYGHVQVADVIAALNDVGNDMYFDFFKSANTSLEDILEFNQKLKDKDIDYSKFISGMSRFILDAMYIKYGISMEDYDKDFAKDAKELFDIYSSNDLDAMLRVVESASFNCGADDNKNELLLTTTALRIGKIKLLANGLGREASEANAENRRSLANYQSQLKKEQASRGDKTITYAPTKQAFADMFKSMTVVEKPHEDEKPAEVTNTANQVPLDASDSGEYMSEDQLASLMQDD